MDPAKELTLMHEVKEHPVIADAGALADLRDHVDALGTRALTQRAVALGVTPPDDRPGWFLVREYAEDGTDRGLFWIDPDSD
jgi:hypothetical protein